MLDLSSRKVYGALAEQCVGGDAKADKVESAVAGHLAGLDSNGNLTDSGVSPTEDVTVEGNPVTFESPFEQDAKSVVVSVKPIQDLHGYDHPWVGGAGKNKLPLVLADIKAANTTGTWSGNVYSIANGTIEIMTDDADNVTAIKVNGTFTGTVSFSLYSKSGGSYPFESANYILNGCPQGGSGSTYKFDTIYRKNAEDYILAVDYGASATADFTAIADADSVNIRIVVYAGTYSNVIFYSMIRLATESDATFAPYSNICPISGIDEVEIPISGENLFDESSTQNGYFDNFGNLISNAGWKSDYIDVTEGTNYHISGCNEIIGGTYFIWFDSNKNKISIVSEHKNGIYLAPTNAFYLGVSEATGIENISVTISHTTTIPLPSTLYDGDVDVTEGSGNSTKAKAVFDGSNDEDWEQINTGAFRITIAGADMVWGTSLADGSSNYLPANDTVAYNNRGYAFAIGPNGITYVAIGDISDVSGLRDYLATNPLEICYPLATPITLSLTPADVELLEGTNVVTTNGEKVAVTYGRSLWQDIDELKTDTEGKLDKSDVADVEGDTASRPYSVNEFMLRSDGFYKVTAPIASGASITASNTTKTTIGAVLTALLNA